ncbi:MAG TPA: YggS family pyridoxal phosphate-dependent enzyme [Thermomicrobiales bacterium]|nr:YggS family pyridoxal phosphate-dependent enzyme [Thermomicrobiales bacterium]
MISQSPVDEVDTEAMRTRIVDVRSRIEAAVFTSGRSAQALTIVAVSKTFSRAAVDVAIAQGLTTFGENRVQEARQKFAAPLPEGCSVRLIGQLQSNKARHAAQVFACVETVDRISLVDALEREAARIDIMLPVLIQVNVAREAQKSGCAPEEAASVLDAILASHHLRCDGLMTIAPLVADAEDARPAFRGLRELRDRLESSAEVPLPTLSMGMSNDYAIAVAEGATHLRLGRAIFGSR